METRIFSDTSIPSPDLHGLNITDLVHNLAAKPGRLESRQAALEEDLPPAIRTPWSSQHDLNCLVHQVEGYGQQYKSLEKSITSFLRRHDRLASLRAESLLLRSRMEFEWTVCVDQRRFVAESNEKFMREATNLCESLTAGPIPGFSTAKLRGALDVMRRDHQRQAEHYARTYDTETQLSKLEYDLQQKEYRLAQAAQQVASLIHDFELGIPGASEPSVIASMVDHDDLPILVEYYFDKAGDVGIAREKITDLEIDHREETERRIFQEDQGLALPESDKEFEETFKKRLTEAETELAAALRKAGNAEQVCRDAGLDPDLYRSGLRSNLEAESVERISNDHELKVPQHPILAPDTCGRSSVSAAAADSSPESIASLPELENSMAFIPVSTTASMLESSSALSQHLGRLNRKQTPRLGTRIQDWIQAIGVDGGVREELSSLSSKAPERSVPLISQTRRHLEKLCDGGLRKARSVSLDSKRCRRRDKGMSNQPTRSSSEPNLALFLQWPTR